MFLKPLLRPQLKACRASSEASKAHTRNRPSEPNPMEVWMELVEPSIHAACCCEMRKLVMKVFALLLEGEILRCGEDSSS